MRTFFQWFLILSSSAIALHYAWRLLDDGPAPAYRSVPLVQGSKSVGLHLAGIAVDPSRNDVYAIVGGESKREGTGDFFILWRGLDGERCGLRFFDRNNGTSALYQLERQGRLLTSKNFKLENADGSSLAQNNGSAHTEAAVQAIVRALPQDFDLFGKP